MTTNSAEHACCDYCGLPIEAGLFRLPGRALHGCELADEPSYCCYGCRFAAAIRGQGDEQGSAVGMITQLGLAIFFTMNVMVFTMALWTQDVYSTQDGAAAHAFTELFRYGCLAFSAPVYLILGMPLLNNVVVQLRNRAITTDLLLVIGVTAAFLYSVIAIHRGYPHIYFEVGCVILVAVTLGRWLEATGKRKTLETLRNLERLLPRTVRRLVSAADADSTTEEIELAEVQVDDVIRVLPGERIPVDGVVRVGRASVDEQLISGESVPLTKEAGDVVFGGTLNLDGDLWIRVTAVPSSGTLQRLVEAVERAANTRGHEQRLADRIARCFIPAVFAVTLATFATHFASAGFQPALMASLAVVLIACPCALGIATPMAFWAAMGSAAKRQVLFRNGDALSRLAQIRVVCLDKTGTLSTGFHDVENLVTEADENEESIAHAASVANGSTHAMSRAIVQFAESRGTRLAGFPANAETIPGRGIVANVNSGTRVYLGSPRFFDATHHHWPERLRAAADQALATARPVVCVGWDDRVRGVFILRETTREETSHAISQLKQLGLRLKILSGDVSDRARRLAESLGIEFRSGLLPHEKLASIEHAKASLGPVAMVGDGINDAPALAAADVGIAMGCGADVSREAADICLLSNDLGRISWSIDLAKRTIRTVHQNLFWAFSYNIVGIALAALGWLNPIIASVAMVGSSLFVVTNSLRLEEKGP